MPADLQQARELFLYAVGKLPPEQWDAYLAETCGPDAELQRHVLHMLQVHREAGSFLERPAAAVQATGAFTPPPAAVPPQAVGTTLGPYKLIETIGEGGMGTVWMAQQMAPVKRLVALKVIKPGMDSKQVLARFEAERQALALMDHPNIAKVLDAGTTAAGRPFFVMELVKGVPITRYCDEHRLTPRQRLGLFVDVCRAVQHAHQKGVIHRDLKPSNVLVAQYDGRPVPKVIDFGIAKATGQQLTEDTLVTGFGAVVGTLEYMSPEQAELNQLDIDTRSDIYSLGVLLYELLTGSTPLEKKRLKEAALLEVLRVIREEEPPRPSTRLSTTDELPAVAANRGLEPKRLSGMVRGELDWMVMKCLEKDRNRRYETANGLAKDVQRYLADEPVLACPPSAWYRFRKFARRNKALLTAATVVAGTLLVASATVTWKWWQAERAQDEAQEAEMRARQGEERAVAAERQSRLREAEALVGQARGIRLSRRPGQRFEALDALAKAAAIGRELGQPPEWFDRLRNEAIAALALPDLQITQEFGSFPPGSRTAHLSDDFELYARTSDQGGCSIRRVADDVEVARLPELGRKTEAIFVAGRVLALLSPSGQFQLWDLGGKEPALRLEARDIAGWGFHPDGRLVGLTDRQGAISVHDVATGERLHRLERREGLRLEGLSFHPTGPWLALSSWLKNLVEVRDWRTGAVVVSATLPMENTGCIAWTPDGRTLLVRPSESGKTSAYAFDPAAPEPLRLARRIEGPYQGGGEITVNPAGDRFVTRGWGGSLHLFDADSGQLLFAVAAPASWPSSLRFDRTGRRLAWAPVGGQSQRLGLFSVAEGREYRYLVHAGPAGAARHRHARQPAVHGGGRLAAVGQAEGVALFDLETGRELAHVPLPGSHCALFDGAGHLLTNGFDGFFRWPVRPDPALPGRLVVGPPERLPFHGGIYPVSASQDGRVIAQAMFAGYGMGAHAGGWVLHPNSPTPRRVDPGASMNWTSVSPDGRWVAFGVNEGCASVYDAATGARVCQPPANDYEPHRFSADGRWLLTTGDNGRLFAAGTWEPGPQLGPGIPWDTTPELAVLGQSNGVYRLVELATGRELAQLEDQEQNTGPAVFSPDGTRLVVEAENGLRVWDLRRIRAGLTAMGLDWDAPPYPKADDAGKGPPLDVTIDQGDIDAWPRAERMADELRRKGDLAGALAAIRHAHALCPGDAYINHYLAYMLALCPDPKLRDAKRAVELATKTVAAVPDRWEYWRALGIAQHVAGEERAAVRALTRSLELRPDGEAFDYFPLAAAHQQLGNKEEARKWYARGVAWMATHKHPYVAELSLLGADAEQCLGLGNEPKPAPDRAAPDEKE